MKDLRIAVVGIGATGTVLSAALLKRNPETFLIDSMPGLGEVLKRNGIRVSGALSYEMPVRHFASKIEDIKGFNPQVVFISTKTVHLDQVIMTLNDVVESDTKFISTHNGLGPEDFIAERFGQDAVFRMSLNFGAALKGPGEVDVAFFTKPNHLGALSRKNMELGLRIADLLTNAGLDTESVDDIKLHVWKKMIRKCTMASICAVTDRTIKDVMDFPPTREIAVACFKEALAVAKAMGYDLGEDYLQKHALDYLDHVGAHKDSMCYDIANKAPTEIDFLGGKIVEYGQKKGVPTPFYVTMTNLVKAMEDSYLN
ncbi:ketopantoate reductase family protein [Thermodesulfobacteriota bacterium]